MIKHNVYFDGAVQSLGFQDGNQDYTIGVVEPGVWDFGEATRPETITILTGYLRISGATITTGKTITINPGVSIVIEAKGAASYLCRYG